jgi:hypothetical protein
MKAHLGPKGVVGSSGALAPFPKLFIPETSGEGLFSLVRLNANKFIFQQEAGVV